MILALAVQARNIKSVAGNKRFRRKVEHLFNRFKEIKINSKKPCK